MQTQNNADGPAQTGLRMLYPSMSDVPLSGLYLCEDLRALIPASGVYTYSNFISSLDGRIAVSRPDAPGGLGVPEQTANARDWRLLLELAAPADAIIVSGRYMRELAHGTAQAEPPLGNDAPPDLRKFRARAGLPPQPALVILSRSLDLPPDVIRRLAGRRVIVASIAEATPSAVASLRQGNLDVILAGSGAVDGMRLTSALAERGIQLAYSIAGPEVLHTLLHARVLQRLYLTTVARLLAGEEYATLVHGKRLVPPFDFALSALYLDHQGPDGVDQLMQVYDSVPRGDARDVVPPGT
ncbi:MAG: dihydrofolate reductase family protein [Thiohalocapsa sp.]|nr:dihydrofolate reductase family protein [Thiohalocapsa sp.]